jgi:hypothetical protein
MPGNPLVRFDEGRVGRTARCRPLSYSTERRFSCRPHSLNRQSSIRVPSTPRNCDIQAG